MPSATQPSLQQKKYVDQDLEEIIVGTLNEFANPIMGHAYVAQLVEHSYGKGKVSGSNPVVGSRPGEKVREKEDF